MTLYSAALFLHVVGACVLFVALGLEWAGLRFIGKTESIQEARQWLRILVIPPKLYSIALVLLLLPGIYLTVIGWGEDAWIIVAFVALLAMVVAGRTISKPRMIAIGQALMAEGASMSDEMNGRLNDRVVQASLYVRLATAVGIVFLMTVRPEIVGSLVTIVVAAGAGFGHVARSASN